MTVFFQDSLTINLIIELPVLGVMGDRPDKAKPHNQFLSLPLIQLSEAGSLLHFKSSYQTPLSTNTSIFFSSTVCDLFSSSSLEAEV